MDTSLQRNEIRNAFLGYLMMDDALYTLKSIDNYDSLTFAYEYLDMAEKRLKGEKAKRNLHTLFRKPEREGVKSVLENEELDEKRLKIYSETEEELINTGNIETTLKHYRERKKEEKKNGKIIAKNNSQKESPTVAVPDKNYESEEERRKRVENENSRSFNTAPPEI